MERELIGKIKDLLDSEKEFENVNWYLNVLYEYVCTFDYQDKKYVVSIEEVE